MLPALLHLFALSQGPLSNEALLRVEALAAKRAIERQKAEAEAEAEEKAQLLAEAHTKLQEEAQKRLDTAPPCSCTRYHGTHGAAILLGDFISAAAEMARPSFFEFCERWEGNYKSCAPRLRAPRLAS